MQEKTTTITDEELAEAFSDGKKSKKQPKADEEKKEKKKERVKDGDKDGKNPNKKGNKLFICFMTIGGLGFAGGLAMLLYGLFGLNDTLKIDGFSEWEEDNSPEAVYSPLTGEKLDDASLTTAPAFCIQTPNGTDGARPQAGLDTAGVVFEAIAEAGITRFAAIYQNPTAAVIGPIRSLRIYYLQWDTPFDCTIVHAGGSGDALAAVSQGYRDLTEDYSYMYRSNAGGRLWNNLFTTSAELKKFNSDHGYESSNIKGFARMTPEENNQARVDGLVAEKLVITKAAKGNTSELKPAVTQIGLTLGGWGAFNVNYTYDAESNRYLRSYGNGEAHNVYKCPTEDMGERSPEEVCALEQMKPSVVVAMVVNERRASDNYHEDIDVIGSGDAYIFQNGTAIHGTWKKASKDEQISFVDEDGGEIRLAPGQTFVTAVPTYGSIDF